MGESSSSLLGILLVVAGLFAFLFIFWRLARVLTAVGKAAFQGRADLNPGKTGGRLRLLSLACVVIALFLFMRFRLTLDDDGFTGTAALYLVLAIAAGFVAYRSIVRAKRSDAVPAAAVLADDPRPPVVYLRSFDDDQKLANKISVAGLRVSTEEGELAEIVRETGPLIAIGRPGEELSYFGAARVYVGQGDWQQQVQDLLSRASLVLLRAGVTPGLSWEIEQCCRRVPPEKLILLIPLSRKAYEEFRNRTQNMFPRRLPEYDGRRAGSAPRAVLYFDPDWTPHMRPIIQQSSAMYAIKRGISGVFLPYREANLNVFLGKESEQKRLLQAALQPILQRARMEASGPPSEIPRRQAKGA